MTIGDITSTARGTGARFNSGKPPLELIPGQIIAMIEEYPWVNVGLPAWTTALKHLGEFQWRQESDRRNLAKAFSAVTGLGEPWHECAQVFDYGRAKYAAWNWTKGMPWSVPLGCAMRHALAAHRGEELDPESGLPHRGHFVCNLVMLAWFLEHYPEGDDRPRMPEAATASISARVQS